MINKSLKSKTIKSVLVLSLIGITVLASCKKSQESDNSSSTPLTSDSSSNKPDAVTSLKAMVLSDPKVLASSLISNTSSYQEACKNSLMALSESQGIFDAKIKEVEETKPDVLLVTGDLTFNGELASHQYVASKLLEVKTEIQKTNPDFRIALVPGENDINNSSAKSYSSDVTDSQLTTLDKFKKIYSSVIYSDAITSFINPDSQAGSLSYTLDLKGNYTLIMMDDCRYSSDNQMTSLKEGQGIITDKELSYVKTQISNARNKGNAVIGLTHHSLIPHSDYDNLIPYGMMTSYSSISASLIKAGMSVVFTGHTDINDVSSLTTSYGSLYDICSTSGVSYSGDTRTVDFTHTYSYSKSSESLSFNSSMSSTTNVTYLDADKETKTIEDLTSYLEDQATFSLDSINTYAKEAPYNYLYSRLPDVEPDSEDKQNKTLKEVLADKGYTAKKINTLLQENVGTPLSPLYYSEGILTNYDLATEDNYSKDKDGNSLTYDFLVDYGIHSKSKNSTINTYRIVISKDTLNKLVSSLSSTSSSFDFDLVLYITDEVLENQINDTLDQINDNLIKSTANWSNIVDAISSSIMEFKVDDSHTTLDLINESSLIHKKGSESQPTWMKNIVDDLTSGTESTILSSLIDNISNNIDVIFDNSVGFFSFNTLLTGLEVQTTGNKIYDLAISALLSTYKTKTLSETVKADTLKKQVAKLKTSSLLNLFGLVSGVIIDSFTTDSDVSNDLTTSETISYSEPKKPA